jgi:hypothetical protein
LGRIERRININAMTYLEERNKRKLGLAPALPTRKEKKPLKKVSPKRAAQIKEEREGGKEDSLDKWFEHWMEVSEPVCAECGMRADWLKEEQVDEKKREVYRLMWRACQAHILPKKKVYGFPSLATNMDNHIVLFPSWGGHLCGCHGFYDSNWYNASTMKIWTDIVKTFTDKLNNLIPEAERKNIPEVLLKELQ